MDQLTDLSNWKSLLAEAESEENDSARYAHIIEKLSELFQHLSPQTAPRLQRDLESCTIKSEQILCALFDRIDLSDKQLLCSFLKTIQAFGYFRMAQITYHIDQTIREESNQIYSPSIVKAKWYEMTPLLPQAGTIGWKGIMNHCMVREEPELSQACLQLLSQKLHFYSIISFLDRFRVCDSIIKRNGDKVAEKLFELIRFVAYEEERMIGLDEYIFNLLLPFIDDEQQAAIIDASIQDLFKPFLTQRSVEEEEMTKLYTLISNCIMNKASLQEIFISKLLEHLKCNMIRMKRRHSTESAPENGNITWKTLINDIDNGDKLLSILPKVEHVEISAKSLQTSYISFWLKVVGNILPQKTLTATNSLKILGVCSFLVIESIRLANEPLSKELSQTLASTIECTAQNRLDKLFGSCNPSFLTELTKTIFERLESVPLSNVPLADFYKSYLRRYLKCCTLRVAKLDPEDLVAYVTIICDKNICGGSSQVLQNIFVEEMSECMENFKNRIANKIMEVYLKCARMCGKRLYKFIKRNSSLKTIARRDNGGDVEADEVSDLNDSLVDDEKRSIAMSSLIFILRIAIEGKDQEILDCYGDLLLKLFRVVESSFEEVVNSVQTGRNASPNPLEPHLAKLTSLYIEHKELVSPYIQHDLIENLANIIVRHEASKNNINGSKTVPNNGKKAIYLQLKGKLETLESQASRSSVDVYQAIINKQYSAVVEQSIGSINEVVKEEVACTHGYRSRLVIVEEIATSIANNSSPEIRQRLLEETISWLEQCDPLDHPRLLHILSLLQSLIPTKNNPQPKAKMPNSDPLIGMLSRISCTLIRLCKSVELGPSIHAYKNSGAHKSNRGIQCCTYSSCIRIYTAIFHNYSPKIASSYMTDAMQICISSNLIQYAKHSSRLHRFFIQLASAIAELLKSICIGRKEDEIVRCSMPIFLAVFSHLIRCVILASDRSKLEALSKPKMNGCEDTTDSHEAQNHPSLREEYETSLERLAIDIGKCLNNMCSLRVKLVDHAPHLISTYIKDIQRASCPDYIKLHLNEGVFRVFNVVDAHQKDRQEQILEAGVQRKTTAGRASGSLFEMIHARLDQASREIFRDMHDNHNKFHRYVGKC